MTCWIIGDERQRVERGATRFLYWRAARGYSATWTDPEQATRFARKEDAEAMVAYLEGYLGLQVSEWDFELGSKRVRPPAGGAS